MSVAQVWNAKHCLFIKFPYLTMRVAIFRLIAFIQYRPATTRGRVVDLTAMNEDLVRQIECCTALPTPPSTAVRIIELANHPNTSLMNIADAVASDPASATKILKSRIRLCTMHAALSV